MAVFLRGRIFGSNATNHDRRERVFIFKTDIIVANNIEHREQISAVNPDSIIFSFHCSRNHAITCSHISITRENFNFPFNKRTNADIVIIFLCDQIYLLESVDKFCTQNRAFCLKFFWKKSAIFRKFSRKQTRSHFYRPDMNQNLRFLRKNFNFFDIFCVHQMRQFECCALWNNNWCMRNGIFRHQRIIRQSETISRCKNQFFPVAFI